MLCGRCWRLIVISKRRNMARALSPPSPIAFADMASEGDGGSEMRATLPAVSTSTYGGDDAEATMFHSWPPAYFAGDIAVRCARCRCEYFGDSADGKSWPLPSITTSPQTHNHVLLNILCHAKSSTLAVIMHFHGLMSAELISLPYRPRRARRAS